MSPKPSSTTDESASNVADEKFQDNLVIRSKTSSTPDESASNVADGELQDNLVMRSKTSLTPDESASQAADKECQDSIIISSPTTSTSAEPAAQISNDKSTSNVAEDERRIYCIFPADPFKISSIAELLASYPNVELEDHDSVSGWGMLFWSATLSKAQWQEVTDHKEVGKVYLVPAEEDREDPDEGWLSFPDAVREIGK